MELGDGSLRSKSQDDQQLVDENHGVNSCVNGTQMGINGDLSYLGRVIDENFKKTSNFDESMARNGDIDATSSYHAGDVGLDVGEGKRKENDDKVLDSGVNEVWSNGLGACDSENSKVVAHLKGDDVVEKLDRFVEADIGLNGSCVDNGGCSSAKQYATIEAVDGIEIKAETPPKDGDFQLKMKVDEKYIFGSSSHFDEAKVEVSGSTVSETVIPGSSGYDSSENSNSKANDAERFAESPSNTTGSPLGVSDGTPATKGYGLKKWRRIRRDAIKDGAGGVDQNRILKRGLSTAGEIVKARGLSSENQQKNEISAASMSPLLENFGFSSLPLGVVDSESSMAMVSSFTAGTESDNSEDRSSSSLVARNKVKQKQEVPVPTVISKEKNKMKTSSVRIPGNSAPRGHHGKGKPEATKKLREERITVEKENSYSSVESDLKCVDSVYYNQMYSSVENNNGRQRERHANYQENDLAQSPGRQSDEGAQTDYLRKNEEGVKIFLGSLGPSILREVGKNESRNNRPHVDKDPLVESVVLLQAAEAALEKEIQILREIGKETSTQLDGHDCSLSRDNTSISARRQELNSSGQLHFEEMEGSSSPPVDTQIAELVQRISLLECLLEEKEKILKANEAKVIELDSFSKKQAPKEGSGYKIDSPSEISKVMETELEELFMKRMEAEIEYMTIVKTTQKFKVAIENQSRLFEEQKSLADEQARMLQKLQDTEFRATILKREAEKVEASSAELLSAEEVLKMRNKVCNFSLLCIIQAGLLCLLLAWFLQLYPQSIEIVPT